jgi:type IV secretory pathway TrbF-like protein
MSDAAMGKVQNWRVLLLLILIMAGLFFGSILFILSRAPR